MNSSKSDLQAMSKFNRNQFQPLPILSEEEKKGLFNGEGIYIRSSYLYDKSRSTRHYNAQLTLHALYETGAILINTGTAYSKDNPLLTENESKNDSSLSIKRSTQQEENFISLMQTYHQIAYSTITNSSHSAKNPFFAIFIMKVALDHLKPETIYQIYSKLENESRMMTITPSQISFPNGSQVMV